MTWLRYFAALTSLILLTSSAQAGKDPIGWSSSGNIPAQTTVNLQYTAAYTFVNNFPKTMPTPLFIAKKPSTGEFTFTDNCSGKKLASGQTCTVGIVFFPTTSGSKSLVLQEQYGANVVPLPKISTTTNAATAPLVTGIVTIPLPANIGTGEHRPVAFQFINNSAGTVIGPFIYTPNYPGDGSFHQQTNTCTAVVTLVPGASCMVTGILSAKSATSYTVGATLAYTGGSTTVSTSTTASQLVTVTANPALPTQLAAGATTLIGFTYTNTGTQAVFGAPFGAENITSTITVNPSTTGSCTGVSDTCTGTASLAAGASCSKTCNFTTTATGDFTVTGTFNYDGPSVSLQESTNVGRLFTITNNCTQGVGTGSAADIWFSFSGAAVGQACPCPAGSTCVTGQCYWNNPSPATGAFHLPSNTTATVIIPDLNPANTTIWEGSFAGRTVCSGTFCATANCNTSGGDSACDAGTSFNSPSTKAQLTLKRDAVDTYLVESINGFTVHMSVAPVGQPVVVNQPYTCGTPGSLLGNGTSTLPSCPWIFTVPGNEYVWVRTPAGTETACTTTSDCNALPNTVCGLRYNSSASPTFARVCGIQLGYWTANQACLLNSTDANAFFSCNTALTAPYPAATYTFTNLYACTPVTNNSFFDSCYKIGATTACCGCVDWPFVSPNTAPCQQTGNVQWTGGGSPNVLDTITWIKESCATMETYRFDTASSTFTCPASPPAAPATNVLNYTISFCPTS